MTKLEIRRNDMLSAAAHSKDKDLCNTILYGWKSVKTQNTVILGERISKKNNI